MESHEQREQQIWELVYGLLSEEEAAQLSEQVCSDPELARLYADVKLKSGVLAEASRIEGPLRPLRRPDRVPPASVVRGPRSPAPSAWRQRVRDAAPWLMGSAAALLLCFSGFLYLKPDSPVRSRVARAMRERLLDEPVRTTLLGPGVLPRDREGYLALVTRTGEGRPAAAKVQLRWLADDRRLLEESEVATDQAGLAEIRTPTFDTEDRVRVELLTRGQRTTAELSGSLDVRSSPLSTHLATDRPVYQPGEVIRYRSVTLSRFDLTVPVEVEIEYRLEDPRGRAVARTNQPLLTRFGVGSGELRVPANALAGEYAVVASSRQAGFPESRCSVSIRSFERPEVFLAVDFDQDSYRLGKPLTGNVEVRNRLGEAYAGAPLEITIESERAVLERKSLRADQQGQVAFSLGLPAVLAGDELRLRTRLRDQVEQSLVREIPIHTGATRVDFYPESGELVAGIPNRLYFFAHNDAGDAVRLNGRVVDADGRTVAEAVTRRDGRGVIPLVPERAAGYRLRIPAGSGYQEIPLPEPSRRQFLVLRPDPSVLARGDPVEVAVHTVRPERPVAVAAVCRGSVVGQTLIRPDQFSVEGGQAGSCRVSVSLDDAAEGVIRLTAYDYSRTPPVPVAERLVFRQPTRRLDIRVEAGAETLTTGEQARLRVSVQDERRAGCPAVLGVSIVDDAVFGLVEDQPVGIAGHFWLTSQLPSAAALEDASMYLQPGSEDLLDLLLGTQGWRRFVADDPPQLASGAGRVSPRSRAMVELAGGPDRVEPMVVADNPQAAETVLAETYRESLRARQLQMNRGGAALLTASLVLLALTLLWRWLLAEVPRFAWAASLLAATCCLIVGLGWMTAALDARGRLAWGGTAGGWEDIRFPQAAATPEPAASPDADGIALAELDVKFDQLNRDDEDAVEAWEFAEEEHLREKRQQPQLQLRGAVTEEGAPRSPEAASAETLGQGLRAPKEPAMPALESPDRERPLAEDDRAEMFDAEPTDRLQTTSQPESRNGRNQPARALKGTAADAKSLAGLADAESPAESAGQSGGMGGGGPGSRDLGRRRTDATPEPRSNATIQEEVEASPNRGQLWRRTDPRPERPAAGIRPAEEVEPAMPADSPADAADAATAPAPPSSPAARPRAALMEGLSAAEEEETDSEEMGRKALEGGKPEPSAAPERDADEAVAVDEAVQAAPFQAAKQRVAGEAAGRGAAASAMRWAKPAEPAGEPKKAEANRSSYYREYAAWGEARSGFAASLDQATLLWEPILPTGPEGQAELRFSVPERPGAYRVRVDGHGNGRLGSQTQILPVAAAAGGSGAPPAAEAAGTPPDAGPAGGR